MGEGIGGIQYSSEIKRDKAGRRFGFVRVMGVTDTGRLEKELDQIFLGDLEVHVNRLRFAKVSKALVLTSSVLSREQKGPSGTKEQNQWDRIKALSYANVVRSQQPKTQERRLKRKEVVNGEVAGKNDGGGGKRP